MLRSYLAAGLVGVVLLCSAAPASTYVVPQPGVGAVMPYDMPVDTWTTTMAYLRDTLDAHSAAVRAVAATPDGSTLFTGGKDGRVRIWDLATGELLQDIPACMAAINDIAVSPDSNFVVTASEDGYAKVWDAVTAELLIAIPVHLSGPESSGAIGRANITIRSHKGTAPRYAAERVPAVISATSVAISPDSLYFYVGSDDGHVRKYSIEENYLMNYSVLANYHGVNNLVLNATGQYLFTGGKDGYVKIYNAELGTLEAEILAYEHGAVTALGLSNLEACIVTGSSGGEVRVWDAATGSLTKKIRAHAGSVNWVGFLPDDSMVLTGGQDGLLRAWDFHGDKLGEIKTHVLAVNDALLSDCTLVTGGADFKVRLWDANFPGCQLFDMPMPPAYEEYYEPTPPPYVPPAPEPPAQVGGRG